MAATIRVAAPAAVAAARSSARRSVWGRGHLAPDLFCLHTPWCIRLKLEIRCFELANGRVEVSYYEFLPC